MQTNTHSSLFHLQPGIFGRLTGAAFFMKGRSQAKGLSNASLNFCTHIYTHTRNNHATRPNRHIQYL